VSFSRKEVLEGDEMPRHVLPKSSQHAYTRNTEDDNAGERGRALLRTSERENEKQQEMKRTWDREMNWQDLLRSQRALHLEREREKELIMKDLLADVNPPKKRFRAAEARPWNLDAKPFAENISKNPEIALHELGKHEEREKEVEKERKDHHGRKERIHKKERERRKQRIIDGEIISELAREMRGHRQRFAKVDGRLRQEEERFRERERSRGGAGKL